jgi:glycosyltransferase involved in cell wall biosynthesis
LSRKFSIVIPTRDRAEVLYWCIETVVCQSYDNLEIIVSDNHSIDNTYEIVKSFNDHRIKYFKPDSKLSMSHNFEFAFSKCTGDYIGSIGDDDGLLEGCFEYLNQLIDKFGEYPISNQYSKFYWGNNYQANSTLEINRRTGARLYDTKEVLQRLYNFENYYSTCPIIYYGFIPKKMYLKAKEVSLNGHFFNSMIPDLYSAILLSNLTDYHIYSLKPYCVAGASKYSTGQSAINGQSEIEKKEGKKFLTEAPVIQFHPSLELCLSSIPILIAESYFQFRDNVKNEYFADVSFDLVKCLNVAYSQALLKDKMTKDTELRAIEHICNKNNLNFNEICNQTNSSNKVFFATIIKRIFGNKRIFDNSLKNIYDAVLYHNKYLKENSPILPNIIRKISEIIKGSKNV